MGWIRSLGLMVVVALSSAAAGPWSGVGVGPASATPSGPPLWSDPAVMEDSLDCPTALVLGEGPVVLLVHGTATTAAESWPDGLGRVLGAAGFDWCTVQLPGRALIDIQYSAEYVVAAVRQIAQRSGGRRVSLVGHSQGALEARWAVRWWPDVRAQVDDVVTLAGVNRGVRWTRPALCGYGCFPAAWQISTGSQLLDALSRVPVPEGPDVTTIRSHTDNLVQPSLDEATAAATIDGATNIAVQDLCPGRPVEHVQIAFDAVAAALVLDALGHPGPADPARVGVAPCLELYAAGIDPAAAAAGIARLYANAFVAIADGPMAFGEPPQRPVFKEG